MKRIEHYCSAVEQIKHEPKKIEEVLAMKKENKQIKMTKGGKAFGAAIAAALVCANIAGACWLMNRNSTNSELTAPAASAPETSIALETTEPAAPAAQAPAGTAAFAEEKPKFGATLYDGFSLEEMDRLEGLIAENVASEAEADVMLRTVSYYAGNAVLKKNGTVVFDGRTAYSHIVPISNLNGFTLEISPEALDSPLPDCELFINAYLMKPTDAANLAVLDQKETLLSQKIMLSGHDTVTLPLELHSENGSIGAIPATETDENANWMLDIELSYRPRVCANEADEGNFVQGVHFTVTTDGTDETTYTPAQLDEKYPLAQQIEYQGGNNDKDEKLDLPADFKPQNGAAMLSEDGSWVEELIATAATFEESTAEMRAIQSYYAAGSALMQNGTELTGFYDRENNGPKQVLTSLDGLTFEIRPDAAVAAAGECEVQISAFVMPTAEAQEEQAMNKYGERITTAKVNGSEAVTVPVQIDPTHLKSSNLADLDGWELRLEVNFHPIVEDEETFDIGRQYAFTLNTK